VTNSADVLGDAGKLPGRSYGDGCAIAHALDLVGERWALLVVRELLLGPKRFTDVQAGVPNARPNVLSQRLRDLEQIGVVRRRKLGPPTRVWVYELTDRGRELEAVLLRLGDWGRRSPFRPTGSPVGVDSLMLALKTHFDPLKWPNGSATYRVDLDDDVFTMRIDSGLLTIARGDPADPDVAIRTDSATFRAFVIEGRPLEQLRSEHGFEVTGNVRVLERLVAAIG
jgi:DNA-binding HxlR family transcriptional regulator